MARDPVVSDLFEPLSDEEIDTLDHFLLNRVDDEANTEGKDEGILDVSTLDGFLTALVSSPVTVLPSRWLPAVWGDFHPVWDSTEDFGAVVSLIMRHMNGIAATLNQQPDAFEPMFFEHDVEGKTYTIVDEWCEGYLRGVGLAPEPWNAGGEQMQVWLAPIRAFTQAAGWPAHELAEEETENMQQAIAPSARAIHAHWLARRGDSVAAAQEPIRRGGPHVGRNDPCPCGSGKKYKKCCLH